ncbi:MAG: hypothetical protein AB2L24_01305 [Mangrovibacterium sp.]
MEKVENRFKAGAAFVNITPKEPHFLYGYPFVERMSTGVHDWLLSSALYLTDGREQTIMISNDIIYVSKASVRRIRKAVSEKTGVLAANILVSATHTHSGPVTVDCIVSANDPIVPKTDINYLEYMEGKIIDAACQAVANASSAEVGFFISDGTGIGTNRHDPSGPSIPEIPVLVIRDSVKKSFIAVVLVCSMHPTVLHEDSTLYSGDFPAFAREILQKEYLGCECPVIWFTGTAGNQSPRHVTKSNTFKEAARLGRIIADDAGRKIMNRIDYLSDVPVKCLHTEVDLPKRRFPPVSEARFRREQALALLKKLRNTSENIQEIRTAEVDWFGAEELLHLSVLAESNGLEPYYQACLPAEIQVIRIGPWNFAAWPGEIFVEYALGLKNKVENTFVITLANGELQGYIASAEAEEKGFYEASNSIFNHSGGLILITETIQLLKNES